MHNICRIRGSNLRHPIYSPLRWNSLVDRLLEEEKKCILVSVVSKDIKIRVLFCVHLKPCCRVKKVSHIILSLSTPLYWGYMCTSTPHRSFSQKRNTSSFILWLLKFGINRLCIIQARDSKPRRRKNYTLNQKLRAVIGEQFNLSKLITMTCQMYHTL